MKCHKLITKENHFHFMFIYVNNLVEPELYVPGVSQNIDSLESILGISFFKDLGYSKNNNSQVILYL